MASRPRSQVFNPREPGIYHCLSRCVRRAHLCGTDRYTKKNYDHRREWMESRIRDLLKWFAIDLAFFAIMGNHVHLLLCNLPHLVDRWSDFEVLKRSCRIFPYKFKMLGAVDGELTRAQLQELAADKELIVELRLRLSDISWFMRQLKQHVACKANREDGKTGHFFEARFRCIAVTNEQGLLICGIYIDLNQIRAQEAETVRASTRTSACLRLKALVARRHQRERNATADDFLRPLSSLEDNRLPGQPRGGRLGSSRASDKGLFEMAAETYFEILDWCGRQTRQDKTGKIPAHVEPTLSALGLDAATLLAAIDELEELT